MSAPIDTVLARLDGHKVRENGRDRWRCACPSHGGTNKSTLSIGLADNGSVLLRCWQGCSIEQIVSAIGLDVADLFPPRQQAGEGTAPLKRRRLLSVQQALDLLHDEAHLVIVCSSDVARGVVLDAATRERLLRAAARIIHLTTEARQ